MRNCFSWPYSFRLFIIIMILGLASASCNPQVEASRLDYSLTLLSSEQQSGVPVVRDGQDFIVRVHFSRDAFVLTSWLCPDDPSFVPEDELVGKVCTPDDRGYFDIVVKEISVTVPHRGVLGVTVTDVYSGVSVSSDIMYSALPSLLDDDSDE